VRGEQPVDRMPRAWPRYMTARVAADYADTSPWTIRRHVRPCGRRGRSFIYAIEDVEQWMRGQPIGAPIVTEERVVRQQLNPPMPRSRGFARSRVSAATRPATTLQTSNAACQGSSAKHLSRVGDTRVEATPNQPFPAAGTAPIAWGCFATFSVGRDVPAAGTLCNGDGD
jgi:hypothetical protein